MKILNSAGHRGSKPLSEKTKPGGTNNKGSNNVEAQYADDSELHQTDHWPDQHDVRSGQTKTTTDNDDAVNPDDNASSSVLQPGLTESATLEAAKRNTAQADKQQKQHQPDQRSASNQQNQHQPEHRSASNQYRTSASPAPTGYTTAHSGTYIPAAAGYYSTSRWVRIPYPLSSFIPPVTPPAPSLPPTDTGDVAVGDTSVAGILSNLGGTHTNSAEQNSATTEGVWYCGFGMSELRDSNVDILNEAADALWRAGRDTPGTRSDSEDL